jgi:hypothetical protein
VRGDQVRGTGPRPRPLSSRESRRRRVRSARPSSDGSGPGNLPPLERQTEEYAEWLASRAESVSAGGSSTDASLPPPRIVVVVDPFRYDRRRRGRQRHDHPYLVGARPTAVAGDINVHRAATPVCFGCDHTEHTPTKAQSGSSGATDRRFGVPRCRRSGTRAGRWCQLVPAARSSPISWALEGYR